MTENKYLKEFKKIIEEEEKKRVEEFKRVDKEDINDFKEGYFKGYNTAKKGLTDKEMVDLNPLNDYYKYSVDPKDIGYLSGVAQILMEKGLRKFDINSAIIGARIYQNIGRGTPNFINKRLLAVVKKVYSEFHELSNRQKRDIKNILNTEYKQKNIRVQEINFNLEGKILTSVFSAITIAGILFGANSFTGAVVGITGKSSLTLGVGLFLAGILGLFISRGKF